MSALGLEPAQEQADPAGRTRARSWSVVLAYALVVASTQMLWLTFAPIDTDAARDYGVSKTTVGWLANVFPLMYVLLALPAGLALDRWFRRSLLSGGALTAIGGLVRLAAATFAWAMAGQLLVAVAQPLVLGALTKTATGYLPERDRPTGIAVGSGAQFLGAIVALVMGPALETSHSLGALLPVQAALACAAFVALAAGLRQPPAAAGPPAGVGIAELRAVWSVAMMRTLTWLAFVGIGVFVAVSTYLQPILNHDRISSTTVGLMLAAMLVAGTIGCAIVPALVARAGAERRYLLTTVLWVAGGMALLAAAHPHVAVDFIAIAGVGFVLLASLPVILELSERRMGASGGVATSILLMAGNAGGLVVAVIVGLLSGSPVAAFLVLAVVALAGLPAAGRLARRQAASLQAHGPSV